MYGSEALKIRELIREICVNLNIEILKGSIQKDHIHLFVSVPPNLSVSVVMQKIKGKTSYKMLSESKRFRKEFWGRHLWARGYFVASSGNITDEAIAEYIENQDKKKIRDDDFQVSSL